MLKARSSDPAIKFHLSGFRQKVAVQLERAQLGRAGLNEENHGSELCES